MTIVRWEPFRSLTSLREAMDRLFEESVLWPSVVSGASIRIGLPPMDIYQTENDVVVKAAIPGVRPEDIDIKLTGNMLTISGERKVEREVEEESYLVHEMAAGSFRREVMLPIDVKADQAQATFENGILTITIPKAERVTSKQVKVQVKR